MTSLTQQMAVNTLRRAMRMLICCDRYRRLHHRYHHLQISLSGTSYHQRHLHLYHHHFRHLHKFCNISAKYKLKTTSINKELNSKDLLSNPWELCADQDLLRQQHLYLQHRLLRLPLQHILTRLHQVPQNGFHHPLRLRLHLSVDSSRIRQIHSMSYFRQGMGP